jgi:PAS domain S-box-containing protein
VDITERKRAEEALHERERTLLLFITHAPAAIAMFDCHMAYVSASHRWLTDYGLEMQDISGRSHYELFPNIPDRWKDIHRRCLAGATEKCAEEQFPRLDGTLDWIRWEVLPWYKSTGTIGGIIIFSETITQHKQAEEALRRLNAELEKGVHHLGEVNRELKERTQENEAFVYSVSHDLRSPLVNLQGFSKELARAMQELRAHLVERELPQPIRDRELGILDGPMAKSIRFIQTAVTRLGNIIDALLRLSRAGRVIYQRERVDVKMIVARVIESLRGTADERGAIIQTSDLPAALGDPAALEQVFANLLGNALNYLDGQRPGRIEIGSLGLEEDHTAAGLRTYYIRDNGLGISETGKTKVFQPFQRLHPQAAAGEGLGLAIVQRVVERHGGSIWFESAVGQGSTFFVSLPAFPNGASAALRPAAPSASEKGPR